MGIGFPASKPVFGARCLGAFEFFREAFAIVAEPFFVSIMHGFGLAEKFGSFRGWIEMLGEHVERASVFQVQGVGFRDS